MAEPGGHPTSNKEQITEVFMDAGRIRPIAICVCRDGERILVFEGRDSCKGEVFYRPLGGSIEYGERGVEAVKREFREEINADMGEVTYLGMLENIYIYEGRRGHEIVLVYDGRLADERLYQNESITGDELGQPFTAVWKRLDEFGPGKSILYPDGLLNLLRT